jgi:hypothetical protein
MKDSRSKSIGSPYAVDEIEFDSRDQEQDFYVDPVAEKTLVRKLDWRLIPWLCLLYLISFLDRTNIGNAKIQGSGNSHAGAECYRARKRSTDDGRSIQYDLNHLFHYIFAFWLTTQKL